MYYLVFELSTILLILEGFNNLFIYGNLGAQPQIVIPYFIWG